jgi:hypothetical protein
MRKKEALWQNPGFRIGGILVLLMVVGGLVAAVFLTQLPPDQPIAFPHRTHLLIGAQCMYCHPAAAWGPDAGLPTTSKCWGCHQQVEKQSAELDKLAGYVERGEQIPWVPVAMQPDFVHFNHRTHVDSGIQCTVCHGTMSEMTVAEPQPRQTMGWCLSCHQKTGPDNFIRLSDCATCHY